MPWRPKPLEMRAWLITALCLFGVFAALACHQAWAQPRLDESARWLRATGLVQPAVFGAAAQRFGVSPWRPSDGMAAVGDRQHAKGDSAADETCLAVKKRTSCQGWPADWGSRGAAQSSDTFSWCP